ncbi:MULTISPECIES: MraY family glycosyltransferase [Pseudomonas syringae group]|uniref:Glycosyl transferase, group 4 family protein n=2 Tax=Pseudomonas syringae group TaxID=136849 RepID=A0A0P9LHD0_PSECA|nr:MULTISPECIES: glycosyltransferase family 4 protein [Pseudomonas syringae group]KAA8714061.1 glycosyltransferase family 4 protein [Pseudomonas cannabina]KPB74572.1 Glycosyl transferase [Pseudomonas syringae pv. maculicola]KPW76913.1 Glycosyl transferase, group 4 family protein [Pseudomonas cannabina]QHE98418.1 glycosyl transferase [Pseudomonas syringae pv. maculicola str. ES4326]QQN23315.1 glycosyltransferase family 4 protein [Pseudomonas cannabina pv. alisalensis]
MIEWLSVIAIALLSLILTSLLRKYALAKSLIDLPNARSSHSIPTPRGGGVSIVVAFLLAISMLAWAGQVSTATLVAIVGSAGLVALIGFMDDHGHIAARWRLLGHFVAAGWALAWLGGLAPLNIMGWTFAPGLVGQILAAFYLVWMLNLYNFMDGIDGIASVEAVTVCAGMSLIYVLAGFAGLAWSPLLLAAAVAGFLYWNFPPARIFMGDAGSGFLGLVLGVLSVQASWASSQLFWSWLILLGVFIVDATVTLGRRLLRGEKVYEAHRSHAYQFASRRYGKHLPVTLAVGLINLFWLLPVAMWVALKGGDGLIWTAIAYIPLVLLALRFSAGGAERM